MRETLKKNTIRLNLGCGNKTKQNFIGVDKYPCKALNIYADLEGNLPFNSSSIDEVWADNVIEHIEDLPKLMSEIHRICRHGATVTLITPHFTSLSSWRDPTHIHHLSYFSMDHFTRSGVAHYIGGGYNINRIKLSFSGGIMGLLARAIFSLNPRKYEEKWCFIFRASTLTYHLSVRK